MVQTFVQGDAIGDMGGIGRVACEDKVEGAEV
jgi:hypothetical protein